MNSYMPSFMIYAKNENQAQEINNLLVMLLNNVPPDKLESAAKKVQSNPKLLNQLLSFL